MKIGILTLPFNNNYGGYLQAYALMMVLKGMGHQVELVYRRNNRRSKKRRIKLVLKNVLATILRKKTISVIPNQEKELRYKGQKMMIFVDKYITPKSKPLYSSSAMYKYIHNGNYDVVIVGSDQVWRPDYGQKHVQDFFLTELRQDCNGRPRLITYAASFGADNPNYTETEKLECGDAFERFSFVSIREQKGLEIITNFKWKCCQPSKVVLDPTFLLKSTHYNALLPFKPSKSQGKIFCYFLDKDLDSYNLQKEVSRITGIETFSIIDTQNWQNRYYIMPSIEDWLSGIRDAEYVLTDSYHGMVFSIIFNKNFIVKCNKSRGSNRFSTVLNEFGLESRLVFDSTNIIDKVNEKVDWENINAKLNLEAEKSINYLLNALQ